VLLQVAKHGHVQIAEHLVNVGWHPAKSHQGPMGCQVHAVEVVLAKQPKLVNHQET
jgi:hypothetical protein